MHSIRTIMIGMALCFVGLEPAGATLIVDTGPPAMFSPSVTLDSLIWRAGEFTLIESYVITDVMGHMRVGVAGDVTVAIYSDGGDIPILNSEIYSAEFLGSQSGWQGASGLNWELGPGTYWIAFEVREGNGSFGLATNVSSPLSHYAYSFGGSFAQWQPTSSSIGIRILGDQIPEPSTIFLVSTGIMGVLARRRRLA